MVDRRHSWAGKYVNYIREFQLARGVPAHQAYNVTMYVLAGMLLLGLLCNLLMRPVNPQHHMTEEQIVKERAASHARPSPSASAMASDATSAPASYRVLLVLVWTAVALPLAWGGWITLSKALVFFRSATSPAALPAENRRSERRTVTSKDTLNIDMAPAGGMAVRFGAGLFDS